MLYIIDNDFALRFNIKLKHTQLIKAIRCSISLCSGIEETLITTNLSIKSFFKLKKKLQRAMFNEVNFCEKLEEILNIKIEAHDKSRWYPLCRISYFILFKYHASSCFVYVGDWIYWLIYNYIKYAQIHINPTKKFVSGQEYLDSLVLDCTNNSIIN